MVFNLQITSYTKKETIIMTVSNFSLLITITISNFYAELRISVKNHEIKLYVEALTMYNY